MILFLYSVLMLGMQGPSGSGGPPPPDTGDRPMAPQLPIDDHVWILFAVGMAIGIYFLYKRNQSTNRAA